MDCTKYNCLFNIKQQPSTKLIKSYHGMQEDLGLAPSKCLRYNNFSRVKFKKICVSYKCKVGVRNVIFYTGSEAIHAHEELQRYQKKYLSVALNGRG